MFLFTPDTERGEPLRKALRSGFAELKVTLAEARKRPGLVRFLLARMIYQDGVNATLALGAGYAAALFNWTITEIGLFGMVMNVVAIFSCLVASRVDTRIGSKAVVIASLVLLLLASIGIVSTGRDYTLFGLMLFAPAPEGGLFSSSAEHAYLIYGLMIGAAFGPVQASSRSWFARSIKPEESGRYFGIYALAGRATSFLGPFLVASVTALTSSAAAGMSVLVVFSSSGSFWLSGHLIPLTDKALISCRPHWRRPWRKDHRRAGRRQVPMRRPNLNRPCREWEEARGLCADQDHGLD